MPEFDWAQKCKEHGPSGRVAEACLVIDDGC